MVRNLEVEKEIFEMDTAINRLVHRIELLSYVNPLNIEKEKKQFFSSKYSVNPSFKYPKLDFNGYKLHRLLFTQKVDRIKDDLLRDMYRDIIYTYSDLIACIETIGQGKKFYYNCLRAFGTPTEKDVENAKFILHFANKEATSGIMEPKYTSVQAEEYFREYATQYGFDFHIKHSSKIAAAAMVLNNIQTLVLKKNHLYSENQLKVLANHEIGVHMVTTMNGVAHPLKIFSHGLPNNVETQEGVAVLSEYMSNSLTMDRLKELAYRVIAVDSLAKGYDFKDTFDLIHNQYKLNKKAAYYITLRVHRGGGFTKDYLYLTGLKKVYDYKKKGKNLDLLLTGKVSLEYVDEIEYMLDKELAVYPKHITDAFATNDNENTLLDFILSNLK